MDVVYICRVGDNEELRYSIRSVAKNLPHDNIWVVGGKPNWYTGNYIKIDQSNTKYGNARNNLRAIAMSDEISEDFVLMNDDFFIMKPIDQVHVWHGGSLQAKHKRRTQLQPYSAYTKYLRETYKTIKDSGVEDPLDYELHTPLPVKKSSIMDAVDKPGLWRSIISNKDSIGGELHEDVKLYSEQSPLYKVRDDLDSSIYMSTDDRSFDSFLSNYLLKTFPDPSPYELSV